MSDLNRIDDYNMKGMLKRKDENADGGLKRAKSWRARQGQKSSCKEQEEPKAKELSAALYDRRLDARKVVLYDQFDCEEPDLIGAMTSRYEPRVINMTDTLTKCNKIIQLRKSKKKIKTLLNPKKTSYKTSFSQDARKYSNV